MVGERLNRERADVAFTVAANRNALCFGLFIADYKHVRDLRDLVVADQFRDRFGAKVYLDANPALTELRGDRLGCLGVTVGDR